MSSPNLRSLSLLACLILLVAVTAVFAQDWPQWRGPDRDGKLTGFTPPKDWTTPWTQTWKVPVGAGDATPALVGDKLYVVGRQGDNEVTLCLDANGKELWRDSYAAPAVTGPAARHPGLRSSPAVADGKVVVLGANGVLSCLDAKGKLLWRKDEFPGLVPKFFTGTSPLITDNLVIAQLGSEAKGGVFAYDLLTGAQKWSWTDEGPMYSSPVLMTVAGVKQIVTLTDRSLIGLALADGKLLWRIPFPAQGMSYNAATPIVDGQTVIYTAASRGTHAVTIARNGDVFAPTVLWDNPDLATQFNTPVLKDGLLFGLSDKGYFFCINAKTGATAWIDTVKRGGNFAAVLDAGSVILALPSTSELIAFKPSADAYTELAHVKVADTPTYAHPVIAGKKIYIRDQDSLILWTLP